MYWLFLITQEKMSESSGWIPIAIVVFILILLFLLILCGDRYEM